MTDTTPTTTLPDTPPWSPARHRTVLWSQLTGMMLTALGAFGAKWGMSDAIATLIINAGTTLLLSAGSLHIGGATVERVGAWWVNRTVLLPKPEAKP